jgi:DNA-directed RNA polymerase subunit B
MVLLACGRACPIPGGTTRPRVSTWDRRNKLSLGLSCTNYRKRPATPRHILPLPQAAMVQPSP